MTSTYLDGISAHHRNRAAADHRPWHERTITPYDGPSFEAALVGGDHIAVIAEIKRRSPSKGWLNASLNAPMLARDYARSGARAISVLTDVENFGARPSDLQEVSAAIRIPCLRKDFIVAENDVLDAAEMGASAILLIASMLTDDEMNRFSMLAASLNMATLFEIHDGDEAKRVIACGASIIGVNQRNLHTFEVDPVHAASIASLLPANTVRVAESGFRSVTDVQVAADAGFDAVLVGESFVLSAEPGALVQSFASVRRRNRD